MRSCMGCAGADFLPAILSPGFLAARILRERGDFLLQLSQGKGPEEEGLRPGLQIYPAIYKSGLELFA